MNKTLVYSVIALLVLAGATLGCSLGSTGVAPSNATPKAGSQGAPTPTKYENHNFGDRVQVGSRVVTLNGAKIQGDKLIADFTVENNKDSSDWQIGFEVMMGFVFTAKDTDGNELKLDTGCTLGPVLSPGAKLRGDVCWSGVKATKGVKIYWGEKMIGSEKVIVWQLK
jgi:hypothetical protein